MRRQGIVTHASLSHPFSLFLSLTPHVSLSFPLSLSALKGASVVFHMVSLPWHVADMLLHYQVSVMGERVRE